MFSKITGYLTNPAFVIAVIVVALVAVAMAERIPKINKIVAPSKNL